MGKRWMRVGGTPTTGWPLRSEASRIRSYPRSVYGARRAGWGIPHHGPHQPKRTFPPSSYLHESETFRAGCLDPPGVARRSHYSARIRCRLLTQASCDRTRWVGVHQDKRRFTTMSPPSFRDIKATNAFQSSSSSRRSLIPRKHSPCSWYSSRSLAMICLN